MALKNRANICWPSFILLHLTGWYEGERIRDGERGWFPADHTEEINNSHVRARNLRLRYRLMIASQEYTDFKFPTKS